MAELLIVVAIIAVLTGISLPVFNGQLEKSREATDLANVRGAYAELMIAVMSEDTSNPKTYSDNKYQITVDLKQNKSGWQTSGPLSIGGIIHDPNAGDDDNWKGTPGKGGKCTIVYSTEIKSGKPVGIVFNWTGGSGEGDGGNYLYNYTFSSVDKAQWTSPENDKTEFNDGSVTLLPNWKDTLINKTISLEPGKTYRMIVDVASNDGELQLAFLHANDNPNNMPKNEFTGSGQFTLDFSPTSTSVKDYKIKVALSKDTGTDGAVINSIKIVEVK